MRALVALVACGVFVSPLAVMVLGALHPVGEPPPVGSELLPLPPSAQGFERAFELVPLGRQLVNSVFVAAIAVPLTITVASLSGFAMSRLTGRARTLAVGFTLIALTIPASALWVPRFTIYRTTGVLDTYVPLIAPALVGTAPFLVLLCFWSARRLPRDIVDAARLEGLGPLRVWWRVVVPLTIPTLGAVGALAFAAHWSNFMEPLLYLFNPDRATLPLGLSSLRTLPTTDAPAMLAGAVVATLPPAIAFALVQRQFLNETRGAGWLGARSW